MLARIVIAAFALAGALAPAAAAERVERFISEVDVQRNGDLFVTETIMVRSEGREIRRGIQRDFPTTYTRRDGSRVEVGFDVKSVTRDGRAEDFTTEKRANGVRVRIGSANRYLNLGSHQYVIQYRTTRQIGFFDRFDELYWNATGTGWTFPIDVAEARINLPERVGFVQSAFYTGPQGARGSDATVVEQTPGRIVFRTTRPLPVANGLTVAAAWPKGVVAQPTTAQQFQAMLKDEPALLYAGLGGGFVIGLYLLGWLVVGRDPRRGTIIPLFGPPEGMSAAAVRYVAEMGFDNRVFTAAIVGLGVNGHLRLVDRGGDQELHHLKGNRPLDAAERVVETTLFAKKSKVTLRNSEHELITSAKIKLHAVLAAYYRDKLFSNNFWWSGLGLLAAVIVTVLIAVEYSSSYGDGAPWILAGMLGPLLPIMAGAGLMRAGLRRGERHGTARLIMGLVLAAGSAAIGLAILAAKIGTGPAILPAIVPYVMAPFAALGFAWLKAPSKGGRRIMDHIEGFKQYLGVAEEDRLEFMNPPEKTPELFERFLPYAIALNVENAWANRFTGVLAAAGVGAAAAASSSWYTSDHSSSSDGVVSFADRVGESLSSTIASASTPPGSTDSSGGGSSDFGGGSSGGGSSGGGGGGGGGSGW